MTTAAVPALDHEPDARPVARFSPLSLVCVPLGVASVVSLLGWVFGVSSFSTLFWLLSAPALAATLVLGALSTRRRGWTHLHAVLVCGTVGGLLGTVGYDLFRIPFVAAGFRLFAPIDSYGVLLLDAQHSSPLTGFAGWAYHVSNGVGFGIAYAAAALGRRARWGVAWAMVLETATVVTPFADAYGLRGRWVPIAIAYGAHVPYGLAVGWAAQRGQGLVDDLRTVTRAPTTKLLAAVAAGLLLWHQPWTGLDIGGASETTLRDGRFHPEWVRVAPGECAVVHNADAADHELVVEGRGTSIAAGTTGALCFDDGGAHRVRVGERAYSGGFVIVDEEA
ncbi:MAG TPA: hypothetical protein VF230_03550 [Acidimicrobiales bacterium]